MALLGFGSKTEPSQGAAQPQAATPAGAAELIVDGSLETFQADVLEASMVCPVLVEFWAPWCGPCKQLMPILEKLVRAAAGKVRMVKINIDENQEVARQLQIQSVPTVMVFLQGQPVTGFQGMQPESQIKSLIEKLTGDPLGQDPVEAGVDQAKAALDAGDIEGAAGIFGAIMEREPENLEAIAGMARCLIGLAELDEAQALLDRVPDAQQGDQAIAGAKASLSLARDAGKIGDVAQLTSKVEENPDDHASRFELSTALFLRGEIELAMEHLCSIVKKDREWQEDGARKQLVKLFDALGPTHGSTIKGRKMLSRVLFS